MSQLRVAVDASAFGVGQMQIDGRLVDHWGGRLPKSLFFFLIDRSVTTREEIFDALWAETSVRQATNCFHVVKGKLNRLLGTSLVVSSRGFYRISSEIDLTCDVIQFQALVQAAAGVSDEQAQQFYEDAIDLYRGGFLEGMTDAWIVDRRRELLVTYAEALVSLARIWECCDNQEKALNLYLRAYAVVPLREDLIRGLMRVYCEVGSRPLALETYNRLVEKLKESLGIMPDPLTVQLAGKIRGMG